MSVTAIFQNKDGQFRATFPTYWDAELATLKHKATLVACVRRPKPCKALRLYRDGSWVKDRQCRIPPDQDAEHALCHVPASWDHTAINLWVTTRRDWLASPSP